MDFKRSFLLIAILCTCIISALGAALNSTSSSTTTTKPTTKSGTPSSTKGPSSSTKGPSTSTKSPGISGSSGATSSTPSKPTSKAPINKREDHKPPASVIHLPPNGNTSHAANNTNPVSVRHRRHASNSSLPTDQHHAHPYSHNVHSSLSTEDDDDEKDASAADAHKLPSPPASGKHNTSRVVRSANHAPDHSNSAEKSTGGTSHEHPLFADRRPSNTSDSLRPKLRPVGVGAGAAAGSSSLLPPAGGPKSSKTATTSTEEDQDKSSEETIKPHVKSSPHKSTSSESVSVISSSGALSSSPRNSSVVAPVGLRPRGPTAL